MKTAALVTGVFLLGVPGCGDVRPADDAAITADLACETARMTVRLSQEIAPSPPKPVPAGKCLNCAGSGVIGDGNSIRLQCPVCKGTGKACTDGRCKP